MVKLFSSKAASKVSAEGPHQPAWRPDFRDVAALPDLKTVRTSFFLNMSATAIAVAVLLFTVHREWKAASLKRTLADVEARTAEAGPASKSAISEFVAFQAEQKKFEEAQKLISGNFRLSDFFLRLGDTLPPNIFLNRVELRSMSSGVMIGGSVNGLDIAANTAVSEYEKSLRADVQLVALFPEIVLTNVIRDQAAGRLVFEILFNFPKPVVVKAPAKGAK